MKIEIFRTGTHTNSNGDEKSWTEKDLDSIVSKYNPQEHEAPIVIGHPKDNAPAYGWVEGLERKGSVLYAKIKDLVPEFVDIMKKGLYKKRSISLYPDMTLRHVGFLGATPPAIKGLADIKFSEQEAVTFEFSDWKDNRIAAIFQRLRDFIIEKFGLDTADKIITSYDIEDVKLPDDEVAQSAFAEDSPEKKAQAARSTKYNIAIKEGGNVTKPSKYESIDDADFADPVNYSYPIDESHVKAALSYWGMPKNREQYSTEEVGIITKRILKAAKKNGIEVDESKWNFSEKEEDMATVQELEIKLKDREKEIADFSEKDKAKDADLAKLKKDLADEKAKNRKAEFQAFCETLEKEGKLTPAMKPAVLDFMEILSGATEHEFSEADDKKVKAQPIEKFKTFLTGLPKQIEFGEHATKKKAGDAGGDTKSKRDQHISEYQEKNKDASYKDAVIAVSKEHPELFEREG